MTRSIIVTGGTGALGKAVVQRFIQAGDHVHILDRHATGGDFVSQLPAQQVSYHSVNVLNTTSVKTFVSALENADVLVNIVGGFTMGDFDKSAVEDLDQMLDLNLRSAFIMSQHVLPLLKNSSHGRIVNIGARQALQGGAQVSVYALSKAAVLNLTQSLAQELLSTSVTVNAVIPSTINTPMNRESMPEADFESWVKPDDLAHSIFFLASPEAQAVSGAILPVYHRA